MFRRGLSLQSNFGAFSSTAMVLAPKAKKIGSAPITAKKSAAVAVRSPAAAGKKVLKARAKSPIANVDSLLDGTKGKGVSPSASIVAEILKKPQPKASKGAPAPPKRVATPVAAPVAPKPAAVTKTVTTAPKPSTPPSGPVAIPKAATPVPMPAPVVPATATLLSTGPPPLEQPAAPSMIKPLPAGSKDSKGLALDIFKQMLQAMTNLGETYKVKAYAQTVAILSKYPSGIDGSTVIPGLGAKSAVKLKEICNTGRLAELDELIKSGAMEKKAAAPLSPTKSVKPQVPVHNVTVPQNVPQGAIPHDEQCMKEQAIKIFQEMYEAMKASQDPFKSKAYAQAVDALKKLNGPLYRGTYVPGIGGKSAMKLKEITSTGRLAELDELKANNPGFSAIAALCKVNGVGPATAKKWYEQHRIDSIDKLRELAPALGLTDAQKLGVKYYDDCLLRIPYEECRVHNALLQRACAEVFRAEVPEANHVPLSKTGEDVLAEDDPQCSVKLVVCGSHRRGRANSGDVDALMTFSDSYMEHYGAKKDQAAITHAAGVMDEDQLGKINRLAQYLRSQDYLVDSIASGDTKMMAYVRLPGSPPEHRYAADGMSNKKYPYPVRRLDIRWVPKKAFAPALLYFTGSADFNGRMRSFALSQGFTLNEYGLFKLPTDPNTGLPNLNREVVKQASRDPSNIVPDLTTEEDIFRAINFDYLNPAEREK